MNINFSSEEVEATAFDSIIVDEPTQTIISANENILDVCGFVAGLFALVVMVTIFACWLVDKLRKKK